MSKYEVVREDGGMGGPGDGSRKTIAYFTSLGKVIDFFQNSQLTVDRDNNPKDFDFDTSFYVKDSKRGLGEAWFYARPTRDPMIQVNPTSLREIKR